MSDHLSFKDASKCRSPMSNAERCQTSQSIVTQAVRDVPAGTSVLGTDLQNPDMSRVGGVEESLPVSCNSTSTVVLEETAFATTPTTTPTFQPQKDRSLKSDVTLNIDIQVNRGDQNNTRLQLTEQAIADSNGPFISPSLKRSIKGWMNGDNLWTEDSTLIDGLIHGGPPAQSVIRTGSMTLRSEPMPPTAPPAPQNRATEVICGAGEQFREVAANMAYYTLTIEDD
ncbi:hypothetical protein SAMD00023353_6900310 [Rosellinia necatrix]|uniref:Uncharacterized protein n=1 Tax=Rosellinia necatrix TaxID=77044 RepID=A0A1W2TT03_ROSNE|nr:hypothetical protein SAMD00023353_6900310 [Rosellinia necatrix]